MTSTVGGVAKDRYNATINRVTDAARQVLYDVVTPAIARLLDRNGLYVALLHSTRMNLLNAIREDYYGDIALPHHFFTELLMVYEAGHLPCGWENGEWPEGRLLVY